MGINRGASPPPWTRKDTDDFRIWSYPPPLSYPIIILIIIVIVIIIIILFRLPTDSDNDY